MKKDALNQDAIKSFEKISATEEKSFFWVHIISQKIEDFSQAYNNFLIGKRKDLTTFLFEDPFYTAKSKKHGGLKNFIEYQKDDVFIFVIQTCLKKESIRDLVYFLATTKRQRRIADNIIADTLGAEDIIHINVEEKKEHGCCTGCSIQ